jgi:hypothetical protein
MYYVSPSCEFGRGNVAVYNVAVLVGFGCPLPYMWLERDWLISRYYHTNT